MAGRKRKRTRRRSGQLGHVTAPMMAKMEKALDFRAKNLRRTISQGDVRAEEMQTNTLKGMYDAAAAIGLKCGCYDAKTYYKPGKKRKHVCLCGRTADELIKKGRAAGIMR